MPCFHERARLRYCGCDGRWLDSASVVRGALLLCLVGAHGLRWAIVFTLYHQEVARRCGGVRNVCVVGLYRAQELYHTLVYVVQDSGMVGVVFLIANGCVQCDQLHLKWQR